LRIRIPLILEAAPDSHFHSLPNARLQQRPPKQSHRNEDEAEHHSLILARVPLEASRRDVFLRDVLALWQVVGYAELTVAVVTIAVPVLFAIFIFTAFGRFCVIRP